MSKDKTKDKAKKCKLNKISNPGVNYLVDEDHTLIMQTLPIYCKAHPDDERALTKLFQHTYTHLHSYLYQDAQSNNYNRKFDLTQEEYQQECYIYFHKRLQSYRPEKCRDANGWFGVVRYIKMDVERYFLQKWEKHTKHAIDYGSGEVIDYLNNKTEHQPETRIV